MSQSLVIAIDGPSGSGKSTTARLLAEKLQLGYLDTGAMYRAVAWEYLRAGGAVDDADAIVAITRTADVRVSTHPDAPLVTINGHDVTAAIREPQVSASVSVVATNTDVRRILTKRMREIIAAHSHRIVVEGRDITTVVAPDADVRILLVADPEARVARRSAELGRALTSTPSPTRSSDATATTPPCPTSLTPPMASWSSTPPSCRRTRWWSRSSSWSKALLPTTDLAASARALTSVATTLGHFSSNSDGSARRCRTRTTVAAEWSTNSDHDRGHPKRSKEVHAMRRIPVPPKVVRVVLAAALAVTLSVISMPSASAYQGWTTVIDRPGKGVILLCKEATSSQHYGPLWKVTIAVLSGRGYTASGDFTVRRNGAFINRTPVTARNGAWVVKETHASRWYDDTIEGVVGTGNLVGNGSGGYYEAVLVKSLATCA